MHRKLIKRLVELQENVRVYHWLCTSYNRHVITDGLYTELSELIDKFIEVFIGLYGGPPMKELTKALRVKIHVGHSPKSFLAYLVKCEKDLESGMLGTIADTNIGMGSVRDEMMILIRQNVYLLSMSGDMR